MQMYEVSYRQASVFGVTHVSPRNDLLAIWHQGAPKGWMATPSTARGAALQIRSLGTW
jgi:hypothetical protein